MVILEEALIVDMDSNVDNAAKHEARYDVYSEIVNKLPDDITLDRVFEHLEEIAASLPDEEETYVEDVYDESVYSYATEEEQIDNMMQSLRQ